jgi:tetratricopeptide (TPR) repeat protein
LALFLTATVGVAPRASAQPTATGAATRTTATPSDAQQKAEAHYKRAREFYGSGAYREAAAELEAAHALDPTAKDLVFNLGIVSEKLGRIDDALRYFRLYLTMEGVTDPEKQKAEALVRRLEGAKREVPPPPERSEGTPPPPSGTPSEKPPERGRIDAATLIAASVAVLGLGVGTTFGIKALADRPKSSFVTGRDGSYQDLTDQTSRAHTEAIVGDVGLGIGIVAAAAAAYLYFARPKIAPRSRVEPSAGTTTKSDRPSREPARLTAAPLPHGGALVLQGCF